MGVASYSEDVLQRFYAATESIPDLESSPTRHTCPFCRASFVDGRQLNDHLTTNHFGQRPVLLIDGNESDALVTIRERLGSRRITVGNCSAANLRLNGQWTKGVLPNDVPILLSKETNSSVDLELFNRFDNAADPIRQSYRLNFRVAEKRSLDKVDIAFTQHLATGAPHMSQVATFLQDARCQGVAAEYADSLCAFVRGVLVKDQAIGTGITLPPAEVDDLYSSALEGLKGFKRPLSTVICGLIRFDFNDFSCISRSTGFARLDQCNRTLGILLGREFLPTHLADKRDVKKKVTLCPVDQALDRVLSLSERLDRQSRWGPGLREECEQAALAETLLPRDRIKVHTLWADAALKLRAREAALVPLRLLRFSYPFEAWAAQQLDGMEV